MRGADITWMGKPLNAGRSLLVLGLLLTLVCPSPGAEWRHRPDRRCHLVAIGIGRFDWAIVLEQERAGRMPYLQSLFDAKSTFGDILSVNNPGERALLASILTGRFTYNLTLNTDELAGELADGDKRENRLVWDWMVRDGQSVASIGHPFWSPTQSSRLLLIPSPHQFSQCGMILSCPDSLDEERFMACKTLPAEVPEALVRGILGADTNALHEDWLRESLAGDLTVAACARETLAHMEGAHLFLYFEGLERLLTRMEADPTREGMEVNGAEGNSRKHIRGAYHVFMDELLAGLGLNPSTGVSDLFIYSGVGCPGEAMPYREHMPELNGPVDAGFFLAVGGTVQQMPFPPLLAPVDLAITWLYLVRCPIPETLDGVILFGVMEDEYELAHEHIPAP